MIIMPMPMEIEYLLNYVSSRLPDNVYFCEEPQVSRWNEELKQWQADGFSDHVYNEGQLKPLSCV